MNTQQNDVDRTDHELVARIVALLDQSTKQIDEQTTAKLLGARKEALAHFPDKPAHAWVPEWAGTMGRFTEPFGFNLRSGLVLLAFLASLAAVVAWHTLSPQGSEIAEIDEALLTDELPINAYLDKGFDTWLKRP